MTSGRPNDVLIIHSPDYHGPDRRVADRRTGLDRRLAPRFGYGWWDDPERRAGRDRRRRDNH